jgi:DNA-binding transcriptional MerR regulator
MDFKPLQVGELAKRTGVTIRTLHHYDEIGLLTPSLHSGAGYRLYTASDVARLQQVLSLRQIGLALEEIQECLDRKGIRLLEVIELHAARLREQIELQTSLCARLENIAHRLREAEEVSADELLRTIEGMTMIESYYTSEQLEQLKKRSEAVGDERLQQVPADWSALIAAVRAEKTKGTDPGAPEVQALARRWQGLIDEFTGGDPGIAQSLGRLWKEQGDNLVAQHGAQYDSRDLSEYIGKALSILKASG